MSVSRRGFLGSLTAFTAAVAGGAAMPSSRSLLPPRPEQLDLESILKECRVLSWAREVSLDGPERLVVEYEHDPSKPMTGFEGMVDELRLGMRPVLVVMGFDGKGVNHVRVAFA